MLKRFALPICMLTAYCLVVYIALHTPMHSDDFPYSYIGLSPEKHLAHYMTWSGRVVADYISAFILWIGNHTASASINSAGSILLIYNIAALPKSLDRTLSNAKTALLFVFTFLLYWISNPNLGQVMFWVVGSANYMWTTLLIVFFIRKLFEYQEYNSVEWKQCSYIFILGLLAGMSNENTSVTIVALVFCAIIYYRFVHRSAGRFLLSGFAGAVIGTGIMIMAPGNFARASGHDLEAWRSSSIFTKLSVLVYRTLPDVMAHIWITLVIFSLIALIYAVIGNKNNKLIIAAIAFFGCFVVSNLVMIASPGYPPRTMNGQFIFLLCSLVLIASQLKCKVGLLSVSLICMVMIAYFIPSYRDIALSYQSAYAQSKVRDSIIYTARSHGKDEVSIPGYYFHGFKNKGDVFDTYHTPRSGPYYGMKKINAYPVGFDYTAVFKTCEHPVNKEIYPGANVECIYTYQNKVSHHTVFIAEFSSPQRHDDTIRAFIKPVVSGSTINKGTSLPLRTAIVNGRYFSYVRVPGILNDIYELHIGTYSKKDGEIKSQFTVK